jgi:hypothetical protein
MSDEQPYEQLTDIWSLVGRTIERVDEDCGVVLVFADRTYARFTVDHGYEAGDSVVAIDEDAPDFRERSRLGLVTAKEAEDHRAAEEAKGREREAIRAAERRREYERLKAEFEGGSR